MVTVSARSISGPAASTIGSSEQSLTCMVACPATNACSRSTGSPNMVASISRTLGTHAVDDGTGQRLGPQPAVLERYPAGPSDAGVQHITAGAGPAVIGGLGAERRGTYAEWR